MTGECVEQTRPEEEQRLRDRLTARKEERERNEGSSSSSKTSPHSSVVNQRRSSSSDELRKHSRGSGGSGGDSNHHQRNNHHHHHNHRRHRRPRYPSPRGPPPPYYPQHHHRGPPPHDPAYRYGDGPYGPPPPGHDHWRGRPHRRDSNELDEFGRGRYRSRSRSRSRTSSPSAHSYSDHSRSRSSSSSSSSRSRSTASSSFSSSSVSRSSRSSASKQPNSAEEPDVYTKDQRTVFVNQLVMRTTEKDLKKYFKNAGLKVNEVILLRDRRTGKHKGCAYVELRRMQDVAAAVGLSGKAPDFQRFPILIKSSEAEKNYVLSTKNSNGDSALTNRMTATSIVTNGKFVPESSIVSSSQRVYVGSLDPNITQEHLFALFQPFGNLLKVALQSSSGISKGFAFLTFADPKEANLAIQTLSGQVLAGRALKTGWASHGSAIQSQEFPPDAGLRAQQALQVLAQLNLGVLPGNIPARVGTVAEARASFAAAATVVAPTVPVAVAPAPDASLIGNAERPTPNLLVHNMYDKDCETEPGWEEDIRMEFEEECVKFGKLLMVRVMSQEPGGKIYCRFDSVDAATACARTLAGRWFDKRLLRVEYVSDEALAAVAGGNAIA